MVPVTKAPEETVERAQRSDAVRNRARVLQAARGRFAEHGLDAQIDDIAADAKLGVGTVYRHFPTKEKLIEALIEDRFAHLADLARKALEVPDPWEAFVGFVRSSAEVQAADRALSEVLTSRPDQMGAAAIASGTFALAEQLVARAKAAGELRADAGPQDVPTIICSVGTLTAHDGSPGQANWRRLLAILLDGLRAPGREPLPEAGWAGPQA